MTTWLIHLQVPNLMHYMFLSNYTNMSFETCHYAFNMGMNDMTSTQCLYILLNPHCSRDQWTAATPLAGQASELPSGGVVFAVTSLQMLSPTY
jgi:hypothetical protein